MAFPPIRPPCHRPRRAAWCRGRPFGSISHRPARAREITPARRVLTVWQAGRFGLRFSDSAILARLQAPTRLSRAVRAVGARPRSRQGPRRIRARAGRADPKLVGAGLSSARPPTNLERVQIDPHPWNPVGQGASAADARDRPVSAPTHSMSFSVGRRFRKFQPSRLISVSRPLLPM